MLPTKLEAHHVPFDSKHIGKINRAAWSWCKVHFQFYMKNHCIFISLGSFFQTSYEREYQSQRSVWS